MVEVKNLRLDRAKLNLAMARACMNTHDIQVSSGIPRPTINSAISGRGISPKTAGRIANALKVDVAELVDLSLQEVKI